MRSASPTNSLKTKKQETLSSSSLENETLLSEILTNLNSLERELSKEDYSVYLEYVHFGRYIPSRHSDLICDYLMRVERGEIDRLMIFMPPRHSKSMTVTETFPSWFIGRNPDRRVIEVSYGDSLARRFGRANRQKIEMFGEELFGIKISNDMGSVTSWDVEGHRGGMISVGIGGGITGQGADLLIIDDPIKNRKEADSLTYRNMLWNEWQNTLSTRLQPGGRVILILTRWHEDDLAGRLLEHEPERWTVLSLPAICDSENDLLGRKIGEPLWPEFGFDEKWAEETKKSVGSRTWNALYQQRPTPPSGAIIHRSWFKYYKQAPQMDEYIQSWDFAFKDTNDGSFVVGQVWGRKGADKYLLDQVRAKLSFTESIRAIVSLTSKWPQAQAKLIEDRANGTAIINALRHQISGMLPVVPNGTKVERLNAVSPQFEAGNVYIPHPSIAPWVHDYVEELVAFPNAPTDDQVDATSQALRYLDRAGTKGTIKVDIF
ncbi:phage terminase large subunit [Geobacillus zalihae]|uniref:phage terminase large subunit n=1 Tax=Geobacillus TaxID=129337 RepID=UPI003100CCDC